MPATIVFDVNETLLDLRALDGLFARHFCDGSVRRLWFAQVLQSALVSTVLDEYRDFGVMGAAALEIISARLGTPLSAEASHEILDAMRALPAHPEAQGALRRLKEYGFRLATLTNSSPAMIESQLASLRAGESFRRLFVRRQGPEVQARPRRLRHGRSGAG